MTVVQWLANRWMHSYWGQRCEDYESACPLCIAWKCHDYLFAEGDWWTLKVETCTREPGHEGPCMGYPATTCPGYESWAAQYRANCPHDPDDGFPCGCN